MFETAAMVFLFTVGAVVAVQLFLDLERDDRYQRIPHPPFSTEKQRRAEEALRNEHRLQDWADRNRRHL